MPNLVTESGLLSRMRESITYRKHEVAELFPKDPASVVFEVLESIVARGQVWRTYDGGRWSYVRLSANELAEIQQRQADRSETPAWMTKTLTGYTESLYRAANRPEPTRYGRRA
ncbi:hypothetical protein ABLT15_26920 [Paraburkholderia tropica]|uniref:hypothetical protein n=1 Tax=Paraburkholderia tropica TaxID=92647 RepID=UPI0032B516C6